MKRKTKYILTEVFKPAPPPKARDELREKLIRIVCEQLCEEKSYD